MKIAKRNKRRKKKGIKGIKGIKKTRAEKIVLGQREWRIWRLRIWRLNGEIVKWKVEIESPIL
jgi:hypothetical protein